MPALTCLALYFTFACSLTIATPIQRRQGTSAADTAHYSTEVQTALYVINSIQANNASASCNDSGLEQSLDSEGYDGKYAQKLLCEAAIGIEIFSDLKQASKNLANVLNGLQASDPSGKVSACQNVNAATLDEAGLDAAGVQSAICQSAATSSVLPSSTASSQPTSQSMSTTDISRGSSSNSASSNEEPTSSHVVETQPSTTSASSEPTTSSSERPQSNSTSSSSSNASTSSSSSGLPSSSAIPPTSSTSSVAGSTPSASTSASISESSIAKSSSKSAASTSSSSASAISSTLTTPATPLTTQSTSNISVAIVTIVKTAWIDSPPLSFPLPKSNGSNATAPNSTTVVVDLTSTAIVNMTKTITHLYTAPTSSPSEGHGPWSWHPYPYPYPYGSGSLASNPRRSSGTTISTRECGSGCNPTSPTPSKDPVPSASYGRQYGRPVSSGGVVSASTGLTGYGTITTTSTTPPASSTELSSDGW